ncbi:MAG: phytanoyl-CoA dioxygenase family protein [Myxococcota bacterium]|nr:phytanoyl-CoA dioxygenase family protein [Myxococcota bacterium]
MITLRDEDVADWQQHRMVVLRGALDAAETRALGDAIAELESWPETPGRWMKYFEGEDRRLCRVEDFLPHHEGLRDLLLRPDLLDCLGQLFGEPALLFKEKINYKLPGGSGFAPHQDAPAFTSFDQTWHLTVMMSADRATPENGCLEIVSDHHDGRTLPQQEDGTLSKECVDSLEWRPLPTEPGDIVIFDSYVPHRSGPNRSDRPRRAIYATYNPASQGDRRADYFARKREVFPPECERVSGAPVDPGSAVFNLGNPIR